MFFQKIQPDISRRNIRQFTGPQMRAELLKRHFDHVDKFVRIQLGIGDFFAMHGNEIVADAI